MFGYKLVKEIAPPQRGNLKWECVFWTCATFIVVLVLIGLYDFLAINWFDASNVGKECFVRFSYRHVEILIAFIAAVFAFLAIVVTAKVNETMNLHSFNLRYGEDMMHKAVRTIGDVERRWNAARKAGVPPGASPFDIPPDVNVRTDKDNDNDRITILNYSTFVTPTQRSVPWTNDENLARRIVKNYFSSALELYRCGAISKKTLRVICDIDAVTLLFNVVEPMELIINEKYKFDVFYDLMKVVRNIYAQKVKESAAHKKPVQFKP